MAVWLLLGWIRLHFQACRGVQVNGNTDWGRVLVNQSSRSTSLACTSVSCFGSKHAGWGFITLQLACENVEKSHKSLLPCMGGWVHNILEAQWKLNSFLTLQTYSIHDITSFTSFLFIIAAHTLVQECFAHLIGAHISIQESLVENR